MMSFELHKHKQNTETVDMEIVNAQYKTNLHAVCSKAGWTQYHQQYPNKT